MERTSGWVIFASTMFVIAAVFNIIYGIVLLAKDDWAVLVEDGILLFDFTTWGWILLILGIIQGVAAWGILSGQTWARVVGIIIASLALISLFPIFGLYPLWNLTIAVLLILVIYGLAVHGDEVAST